MLVLASLVFLPRDGRELTQVDLVSELLLLSVAVYG